MPSGSGQPPPSTAILASRVPENLFETIEKKHGKVVGLSLAEVGTWITEAKAFKD